MTWALTGRPLPADEVGADIDPCGGAQVRVIAGEPGRERAYRALEYIAAGTIDRLWITDAYMVPPPRLFQALVDAARAGADIRLLVPGASDVPVVRCERLAHMSRVDVQSRHAIRLEPNAHGVVPGAEDPHIASTGNPGQDIFDLERVAAALSK